MNDQVTLSPLAGETELFDPAVTGAFAEAMAQVAREVQTPPWCGYVGRRNGRPVGFGGFKGAVDELGMVEIGYLTFPAFEGQGVATAIAGAMIDIARLHGATTVLAHTLPTPNASSCVLEKIAFIRDGEAEDPDEGTVWRWVLKL